MKNETLREIRFYLGMTQAEFSEYIGVHHSTIAMVETGQRRVSESVANKVARHFDVSSDDFRAYQERRKRAHEYFDV